MAIYSERTRIQQERHRVCSLGLPLRTLKDSKIFGWKLPLPFALAVALSPRWAFSPALGRVPQLTGFQHWFIIHQMARLPSPQLHRGVLLWAEPKRSLWLRMSFPATRLEASEEGEVTAGSHQEVESKDCKTAFFRTLGPRLLIYVENVGFPP